MVIENLFEQAYHKSLEMLQAGIKPNVILSFLATSAEKAADDGAVCSILLVNQEGNLTNGASPKLPDDYLRAIDGLRPHPNVGTCAAAAATGKMVLTPDFYADNKWAELRHLPVALGFKGAWSMPIKNSEGQVVGTFGTYYRTKRQPSQMEIEGVGQLSKAAALVIAAGRMDSRV